MKKFKEVVPFIIIIAVISAYGFYISANVERFQQLINLSWINLSILFFLVCISFFIRGVINYLLYQSLNIPISYWTSFGLAAVNTLANQLPISGGIIAKGVYLKKKFELSYTTFLSATISLFLSFISINGLIGIIVLLYLRYVQGISINFFLLTGLILMTMMISLQWIPLDHHLLPKRIQNTTKKIINGWQFFSNDIGLLLYLLGFQILSTLVTAGRFYLAFRLLSQDVSLALCVLFSAASILTQLVSLAPGGIGIREGIVAGIATISGFDPAVSAVAVGLDRLLATFVIFLVGGFFSYLFSKDILRNHHLEPNTS